MDPGNGHLAMAHGRLLICKRCPGAISEVLQITLFCHKNAIGKTVTTKDLLDAHIHNKASFDDGSFAG